MPFGSTLPLNDAVAHTQFSFSPSPVPFSPLSRPYCLLRLPFGRFYLSPFFTPHSIFQERKGWLAPRNFITRGEDYSRASPIGIFLIGPVRHYVRDQKATRKKSVELIRGASLKRGRDCITEKKADSIESKGVTKG